MKELDKRSPHVKKDSTNSGLMLVQQTLRPGNIRTSLTLCVLEVMPPEWPDLVLTTDIPHCKTDVPEFYRLNIKTCG